MGMPLLLFFFLALNDTMLFHDVSAEVGLNATHRAIWEENAPRSIEPQYLAAGTAWADYDNDGWPDLFVTGNLDPNVLYRNGRGLLTISEHSPTLSLPNIPSGGAVWADYDNDGWPDLYVLNMGPNRLFRNLAGQGFADVTTAAGLGDIGKGTTAAWGDYDADGHLDLYVVNWSCIPECQLSDYSRSRDALYHNNGDGSFTDVSGLLGFEQLQGAGFSASWVDYDNDRDLDLYVVNDKVLNALGNVLWRNDGPGCDAWCFTDVSSASGADTKAHAMGLATGDYDNDGDLDFYFSNMAAPMVLLQNQGDGSFIDMTEMAAVGYPTGQAVGWGAAFLDYDNDGWLDLFLTATGMETSSAERDVPDKLYGLAPEYGPVGMHAKYPDMLYHNDRDGSFSPVAQSLFANGARPTMGLSTADYDRDGRVDFALTYWNIGHRLFRNNHAAALDNHWIAFDLQGGSGLDADAIGTRLRVDTDDGLSQIREVKSGSSLGAGNDLTLHFGLGKASIERVLVSWLNGDYHEYTHIAANQRCLITPERIECDKQPMR